MFAAIYVPRFALQAILAGQPSSRHQPAAVLDAPQKTALSRRERGRLRIVETSGEAAELGVYPGMTATQAQARCESVLLLNRSPRAENELTGALLELAGQFTPDFEDTAPGSCLLDLRGTAAPARQAPSVARQIRQQLQNRHCQACVGLAAHPDLAELAARAAVYGPPNAEGVLLLEPASLDQALGPLPLTVLGLEPEQLELFDLWGIRTIGAFTALKRADLVERLGESAGKIHDRATGKSRRLLRLVRPAPEFCSREDLDEHEITATEPLLLLMQRHLEKIASRLEASYRVAERLSLRLDLAGGGTHHRMFRIPEPTARADIWAGMLRAHLESFAAAAPVRGFELGVVPARPGRSQGDLFAPGLKDPKRLSETLARVESLLGSERFGAPQLLSSHRSGAFVMRPFHPPGKELPAAGTPGHGDQAIDAAALEMRCLPLKQLRPRRHVTVGLEDSSFANQNENVPPIPSRPAVILSGDCKGRLCDWRGPFLTSGHWWEKTSFWRREEWDVLHENGRFYRLVREGTDWFVEAIG